MESSLVIIGVKLGPAPEAMRERFRIDEKSYGDSLHSLIRSEGIDEAVLLANDARAEFIVWASDAALAANSVLRFLTREFGLKLSEWSNFYRLVDDEAFLHVIRTACGLDSLDAAEPAIVDDLSRACELSRAAGCTGGTLDSIMEKAIELAHHAGEQDLPPETREKLAAHEAAQLRKRLQSGQVAPMVAALRGRLEEICKQELGKLADEFGPFTEDQQQALSKLAAHITQRISGSLAREFKDLPDHAEQDALAMVVQRLFRLELEPARPRTVSRNAEGTSIRERVDVQ